MMHIEEDVLFFFRCLDDLDPHQGRLSQVKGAHKVLEAYFDSFLVRSVLFLFKKSEVKVWECRNCGHIVVGTEAPELCPVCAHPQSYFEITAENY